MRINRVVRMDSQPPLLAPCAADFRRGNRLRHAVFCDSGAGAIGDAVSGCPNAGPAPSFFQWQLAIPVRISVIPSRLSGLRLQSTLGESPPAGMQPDRGQAFCTIASAPHRYAQASRREVDWHDQIQNRPSGSETGRERETPVRMPVSPGEWPTSNHQCWCALTFDTRNTVLHSSNPLTLGSQRFAAHQLKDR